MIKFECHAEKCIDEDGFVVFRDTKGRMDISFLREASDAVKTEFKSSEKHRIIIIIEAAE